MSALFVQSALGCSCRGGANPCDAFKGEGNAIFLATAIEEIRVHEKYGKPIKGTARKITLRVDEVFKGDVPGIVETSDDGFQCDNYPFKKGNQYLVYANQILRSPRVIARVRLCSGTGLVEKKKEDIDFLRRLKAGERVSVLHGTVYSTERFYRSRFPEMNPMANATVEMYEHPCDVYEVKSGKRAPQVIETQADEYGNYKFVAPPKGTFRVRGVLGNSFWNYTNKGIRGTPIKDAPFCRKVDVYALPNGTISGRLLHADGTPAKFTKIRLEQKDNNTPNMWGEEFSDENGRFEIRGVSNGRYLVALPLQSYKRKSWENYFLPSSRFPFRSFFYGGTFIRDEASVIEMKSLKAVDNLEITFPERLRKETFNVQVKIPNGEEMEWLRLYYGLVGTSGFAPEDVPLRHTGFGTVELLHSLRYRVWVDGRSTTGKKMLSDIQIVEGNSEAKDLVIELKERVR